jgi:hypothetical protein
VGQGDEPILFSHREVVADVIFMVVSIDHPIRMKGIQELQKSVPTKGGSRINQESVNKKSIHLIKRKPQNLTGHSNRIDKTIGFNMDRYPVHALTCLIITPLMMKLTNSFVWFTPNEWSGLFLP